MHKLHKLERISERQYNGCHIWLFSYTLSELHRPPQNSAAGLKQAVHPKLFKGLFLSSLTKAASKLFFCLYWFSSLLKVSFYPLCYWMQRALYWIEYMLLFFFSIIKKLLLINPRKPFKGKISEDQPCLLVIWRQCLSFLESKGKVFMKSWLCRYFNSYFTTSACQFWNFVGCYFCYPFLPN